MNLLKRFDIYQKERFPLIILIFTTGAVVLSSNSVTLSPLTGYTFLAGLTAGVLFIFHIRVVDEVRDSLHDRTYHTSRPIPRGTISIKELKTMDLVGILVFLTIGFTFGIQTLAIGIIALLYTFLAGKEFFLGEKIRSKFFIYNGINLIQMILLQFFVYSLFSAYWYSNVLVWTHLVFIFFNVILLEVLRKIKIAPEESIGHDTYSWHIGFSYSLIVFIFTVFMSYFTFLYLILNHNPSLVSICASVFFMISLILSAIAHNKKKNKKSENYLYLWTLIMYVGLNILIYITI
ncbi:MAG TPA: hypothetical protein VK675_04215 [Candidatus Paceibacterota bacterium]|nr:hypothetical protein [Candidatus Paceibacterota bacterium]